MLKNFRAYQTAVLFYKTCEKVRGPNHLLDQLMRASSSIALNLAEGSERPTDRDKRRFYRISMASLRESQAILDLLPSSPLKEQATKEADQTAANIFRLCQSLDKKISTTGTENGALGTVN